MKRKYRRSNRRAVSAEPAFTVGLRVVKIKHTFFMFLDFVALITDIY